MFRSQDERYLPDKFKLSLQTRNSYPLLCATRSHIRLGRTDHFLSTYYFQGTKKSPFRSFISFNSTPSDIKYKGWMWCLRLRIQHLRETIAYEATWCPSLKKLTKPANYQIPRIPILRGTRERSRLDFRGLSWCKRFQMVCSAFSLQRSTKAELNLKINYRATWESMTLGRMGVPGGPGARAPSFHRQGRRFDPWSGTNISQTVQLKPFLKQVLPTHLKSWWAFKPNSKTTYFTKTSQTLLGWRVCSPITFNYSFPCTQQFLLFTVWFFYLVLSARC